MKKTGILFAAAMFVIIISSVATAKEFKGNVIIKDISQWASPSPDRDPDKDLLSICTDDVKYRAEPGSILNITLYIRNPMLNRSYKDLFVTIPSDVFNITLSEQDIGLLEPQEVKIINFTLSVPAKTPVGKYPINIVVNTRDYPYGEFFRTKLVIVRNGLKLQYEIFIIIASLIILAVILRSVWAWNVNRRFRKKNQGAGAVQTLKKKRKSRKKHKQKK